VRAFGADVDYVMLVKLYGASPESETRYSPVECIGCKTKVITGNPDPKAISNSYSERQNLNLRMQMRRFTRLTNGCYLRRLRIMRQHLPYTPCTTTSFASTKRFG
jgi:hypothetical protein